MTSPLLTHFLPMHSFSKPRKHFPVFWCFHGVEKGCIGDKWVNNIYDHCSYTEKKIRSSRLEVFLTKGVLISLKSHFDMGVLLQICCIFSEQLLLRTPLEDCFWKILILIFMIFESIIWTNMHYLDDTSVG